MKTITLLLAISLISLTSTHHTWQASGNNIYYNNGNVGIGTPSPSSTLHVIGDITVSGSLTFVNATGTGNFQAASLTITGDSSLQGLTFTNATGTANLQIATLIATGVSSLQGLTFANATGTNLTLSDTLTTADLTTSNLTATGTLSADIINATSSLVSSGTLAVAGQSSLASVSSTNLEASG
ncbi:MAG: hypothetical protein IIA45_14850, partial [Bacteroidetes bacterium]|nr:hypothetical protein [Bacteroidota bacterium]